MAVMRRLVPYVIASAAVVAVLIPVLRPDAGDSYPISSYPMFTADRDREETIATAVALTRNGEIERLSPKLIAGTDEPVHAASTVSRSIRRGNTDALCDEIATRVEGDPAIVEIEVRAETYDTVAWFETGEPIDVETHSRCVVP